MPTPHLYEGIARRYQTVFSKKRNYAIYIGAIAILVLVDNLLGEETHFIAGKAIFVMLVVTVFLSAVHALFKPRPEKAATQSSPAVAVVKALLCNALLCFAAYALLSGFIRGHLGYNTPAARTGSAATHEAIEATAPSA